MEKDESNVAESSPKRRKIQDGSAAVSGAQSQSTLMNLELDGLSFLASAAFSVPEFDPEIAPKVGGAAGRPNDDAGDESSQSGDESSDKEQRQSNAARSTAMDAEDSLDEDDEPNPDADEEQQLIVADQDRLRSSFDDERMGAVEETADQQSDDDIAIEIDASDTPQQDQGLVDNQKQQQQLSSSSVAKKASSSLASSSSLGQTYSAASLELVLENMDDFESESKRVEALWGERATQLPLNWPPQSLDHDHVLPIPSPPTSIILSPFDRRKMSPNETLTPIRGFAAANAARDEPEVTVPLVHVRGCRQLIPADEEVCLLCGATGCSDWQIFCHDCGECFHTFCLSPPININQIKPSIHLWRCPHCKFCEACHGTDQEDKLIVCDSCDRCYHMFCLQPPLEELPQGGWRCSECNHCIHCGGKTSSSAALLCDGCGTSYSDAVLKLKDFVSGPESPFRFPRVKMTIAPLRKQRPIVMERLAGTYHFEQWVPPPSSSPSTGSSVAVSQALFPDMSPEQSVPPEILNAAPVISITELALDLALERASMVSRRCYFTFADAAFLLLEKVRRPMSPAVLTALALENALTRTRGSNPQTTMQANITAETKLENPRFKRIGRGLVALTEYGTRCNPPVPTIKEQPNAAPVIIQESTETTDSNAAAPTASSEPIVKDPMVPARHQIAETKPETDLIADNLQVVIEAPVGHPPPAAPVKDEFAVPTVTTHTAASDPSSFHSEPIPTETSSRAEIQHPPTLASSPAKSNKSQTPKKKRPRPESVSPDASAPPKSRRRKRRVDEDDPLVDVFTLLSALAPYNPALRDVLEKLPAISTELLEAAAAAKNTIAPATPATPANPTVASAADPPLTASLSDLAAESLHSLFSGAPKEMPDVSNLDVFNPEQQQSEAAPALSAGFTSAVVLGSPAVVLASGQTSPHLLWKTRGRPRKDGLPKISKLQLAYIASKCDLSPQALMQHIADATKLRLKANPIHPFDQEDAGIDDRPRKKQKNHDFTSDPNLSDQGGVFSSDASGPGSIAAASAPGFIVTAPPPKKKRRPKTKVTNVNMYDKSAFTSDFGLLDESPRRRKKYKVVEPVSSDLKSQRRSAREAANGMAAVLESESALFVDRESRKAFKLKKPKIPAPPPVAAPDVGHVWQLSEMLLMCSSLDSGIPLLALLSEEFDLYSLSSVYELELLRRSELVAPQMRKYLHQVRSAEDTAMSIYSLISRDNLEDWDRVDPLGTGANRRCYLCADCGDNVLRGRLIQFDLDLWVHVNCISWSFEVFETDSGDLINVSKALERGKTTKCKVCNTLGATLNCKVTRCPCAFHFTCAIRANSKFIPTEHTLMCETHAHGKSVSHVSKKDPLREIMVTTFETPYWALLPIRRVSIDPEAPRRKPGRSGPLLGIDNKTRSLILDSDPKALIRLQQHRVGSLTVKNLGRIVWEYPSFHTSSTIVPGDYFASRKFWSWRGSDTTRSIYHLEVVVSVKHKRPLYRVVCVDDPDPSSVIQAWTAEEAWRTVVEKVNQFRQSLQAEPVNPVRACLSGDIYFGFGCPTVMRFVERLPNLSLLTSAPVEPYIPQHTLTIRLSSQMIRSVIFKGSPDLEPEVPLNPSGCARSEPYRKIGAREKFTRGEQFGWHPASLVFKTPGLQSAEDLYVREADAIAIAQRYQKMKETEYSRLRVMRSRIHEWGVFALEPIKAGEFMLEYVGELIRPPVSDAREKFYDSRGFGTYMFRLDEHFIVDATVRGNMARFVNHCCEPNSATDVFEVQGKKHIIIYARRDIRKGEELTYDYMFNLEDDSKKIPCYCGARHCRGWMN